MSEWMPIESAPKDGTDILVAMPHVECGVTIVYWSPPIRGCWRLTFDGKPLRREFLPLTHWHPLPEPPK